MNEEKRRKEFLALLMAEESEEVITALLEYARLLVSKKG